MAYIIYRATAKPVGVHQWRRIVLYVFAANAADLDFIPGLIVGDPNRYHHGISHSIGFAIFFASVFGPFQVFRKEPAILRTFALFFCLYCSHIVIDYFSIDNSFPYGVPFFWPLNNEYYIAPFALFRDITRSASSVEFLSSLFSLHNLWAVSVECLLLFPLIVLVLALRRHHALR